MINITFLDLHLPPPNYNYTDTDHIIVLSNLRGRTGEDQYDEIAVVYGATIPEPILTDSNEVLIKFVTQKANSEYRGFRLLFNSTKEECGGEIQAETGVIQSPGYPVGRDIHRYCEWQITVPKGRRVRVDIIDYDVRNQMPVLLLTRFRRISSRLAFYYHSHLLSPIRMYLSSLTGPSEPIYSTDNKMIVTLFSVDNAGHRGLKLNFTSNEPSLCIGDLNGQAGSFSTPANLSKYYCEYERTDPNPFVTDSRNVGTLAVRVIDSTDYTRRICEERFSPGVTISYTNNMYEKMLIHTCGTNRTDQYVATPFSDTKLIARNYDLYSRKTFQFQYKVHNCGGLFRIIDSINVSLPTFPDDYGTLDCAWQFKSDDQQIQISVSNSQLDCDHEYIQIYNGEVPTSPMVAKICGNNNNSNRLLTLMKNMFIEYHVDTYKPSTKLDIQISTQDGICGGELQSPHYFFSSPRNGTNYPNNVECTWDLKAQNGFHIGLMFVNRFFLESSPNCSKDYVAVYDKVDNKWVELGKFCGRETPRIINSTGTELRVVLRTDANNAGDGFAATWMENCGGIFIATNELKYIESPGYPNRYMSNLNCNYTIMSTKEEQVNINFIDFDLQTMSFTCEYDNVTIYKTMSYSYPPALAVQGTYCHQGSLTRLRSPSEVVVHFRTDRFISKRGFKFEYSLDRCGGNVTQSTRIQSPTNEDNNYLIDAKCVWKITAPENQKIVIRLELMDMEHNDGCYMDYVDIFTGHTGIVADRRARICGTLTDHLPVINIPSNKALVKMRSDATIGGKGFIALIIFMQSCDSIVKLNSTNPTYTLDRRSVVYDNLLDCHYEFTVPEGFVVKLEFEQFHVANCTNATADATCSCDFVEVRDGAGPFSELIGLYCGFSRPPPLVSSSNSLWMRFATGTFFIINFPNMDDTSIFGSPLQMQRLAALASRQHCEWKNPLVANQSI